MVKVKMFGDFAEDAQAIVEGFAEALFDWRRDNPHVEIVSASTSLAYDPTYDGDGVHGILTVVYREPEPMEED